MSLKGWVRAMFIRESGISDKKRKYIYCIYKGNMGRKLDEVRLGHQKNKEEGRIGFQWWKSD